MNTTRAKRSSFFSGTSGLVLPVANKQLYPPEYQDKSRLTYYASLFNSIEINSSFKKLPMQRTVEKWAASVPDDFYFTFKMMQGVTHNKGLTFSADDIKDFFQRISVVGEKRGSVLVQFPGKLTVAHSTQLENLLRDTRQFDTEKKWDVALEFRNTSWYNEDVYELLRSYDMGIVLHDMPSSAPPPGISTAGFMYVRFHGPEKGYRGSYPDDHLFDYGEHIKSWLNEGKAVYVYFNNTLGNAVNNLITLNGFIDL